MRTILGLALGFGLVLGSVTPAMSGQTTPAGGKYKQCHGYVDHVSLANVRVHCVDGRPADLSFLSWPKFVQLPSGKTIQTKDLKRGTGVHVLFTQSLGVRHVYKVFVLGPNGHGMYGFKG